MLASHFQMPLVGVSILVAILASYVALSLAGRITKLKGSHARWWIAGGALTMGTGIWSMHFIGMLAFRLPIPIGYDLEITLLSLALPIVVSAMALWQICQPQLPSKRLLVSAVLMGVGINAMHYTGMAAMRMDPGIIYDPLLFVASVLIAISASGAALWIAFRLKQDLPNIWLPRLGAAIMMGLAIVGMHYTGMAAAHFPANSICRASVQGVNQDNLAIMVILATFGLLTIAMMASIFDTRLQTRSQILSLSQATANERRILLEREREARAEAERMSSLKDEFLATLSHELRTPLNSILGWAQILRLKTSDEAYLQKGLEIMERNARAQAKLIDDLLDMNRIISGKVRLEMQLIDPAIIIKSAIEAIRPAAQAKNITLEEYITPESLVIQGDTDRLQQVMWNLLTNAVKFTPSGGQISVRLERLGEGIQINVQDTGKGITPDFLPFVFDRFRQADASTTRRYGGLGLGLSIVKNLVELHGGSVGVASAGEGQGALFTVNLPVLIQNATPEKEASSLVLDTNSILKNYTPIDLSERTILVVDDAPDSLALTAQVLAACGAKTFVAPSALEGLELLQQEKPDLIISDISMPEIDGYELIRRVRAMEDPSIAKTPAMALTAFTRVDDRDRAIKAGFNHFMSKPIDTTELLANIKGLIETIHIANER